MVENDYLDGVEDWGLDGVLEMLWVSCTGRVGIQSDCSCQIEYCIFTISNSNDLIQNTRTSIISDTEKLWKAREAHVQARIHSSNC
jgi:hypothetical protein